MPGYDYFKSQAKKKNHTTKRIMLTPSSYCKPNKERQAPQGLTPKLLNHVHQSCHLKEPTFIFLTCFLFLLFLPNNWKGLHVPFLLPNRLPSSLFWPSRKGTSMKTESICLGIVMTITDSVFIASTQCPSIHA
jgi:hypothetical protein